MSSNNNRRESNKLNHLAIIMDGNARWAREHKLYTIEGHKRGAEKIKELLQVICEFEIPHLTLYCFSSENWNRSQEEVFYLLQLFSRFLNDELAALNNNQIRLKIIGNLELINKSLKNQIINAEAITNHHSKFNLYIAFSYGGRQEIVDACQKLIDDKINKIDIDIFKKYLYIPNMPDVDLLIRTADTYRISNFLLWQTAYSELYFLKKYWPDFSKEDLIKAIDEYSQRKRNFGTRK